MLTLAQAAFVYSCVTSILLPLTAARSIRGTSVCNGYAELCSRTFGNVSYVGAHDSYAVAPGSISANQDYNVTTQLNDGIRMLQVQVHDSKGVPHLCHTSCSLLDAGPFVNYLTAVKEWVEANPTEVISILIVNSDSIAPTIYDQIYKAAGLNVYSYSPPSATIDGSQWPTLGTLIDQKKTVLTFMDYHADFTNVAYIIDEFSNIWETAYDVTDQTFNCAVNRTGEAGNKMYLINHFLDKEETLFGITFPVPDTSKLNETNAVSGPGSLGLQAEECGAQYQKYPTFMLVDFYEYGGGSVFQVAAQLNGVTYSSPTPLPTPLLTTTSIAGQSQPPNPNGSVARVYSDPIIRFGALVAGVVAGVMLVIQ
ncbi:PLC-like phosphodiesterase [Cantharellus anzutake]|uniref:PLC-like phosphodiesterase n=1 Tax=Cantharellus anzutake TaxID=1750568 RepID=UPI001908D640|nr:PLC-like phosphodiesterase [Cantharellus anzutake]KAF8330418.1 PLC-like phosphodiesterase [Cantharellus anzutake]